MIRIPAGSTTAGGGAGTVTSVTAGDATITIGGTAADPTVAVAGVPLNKITAATGAVTIASGNNTGIVWNWANTADSTIAFTVGETTAATNGTSTSGVPNQVLLKLNTLATSTQSPLSVYSRAAHVFSVAPDTIQILAANGTAANPLFSFAAQVNSGLWRVGNNVVGIAANGQDFFRVASTTGVGLLQISGATGGQPTINGIPSLASVNNATSTDWNARFSYHSATEMVGNLAFLRSRGTAAVPTVITTGDNLAMLSGAGYVGGTNTYQIAGTIICDSTGTISDSATGIAGIWRFLAAKTGAEATEIFQVNGTEQHSLHTGTAPTISAGGGTGPSIVGADEACVVTIGTGGIATTVTVQFANAFTNAPVAVAQSDTDIVAFKIVTTTTTVKIDAALAFTAGSKINIITRGYI